MRLVILGKTKDEKGTQLEQLTKTLLEHQGYSNVATNVQVGGGSELDVNAIRKDITGIKTVGTPVLCECKAHQAPITLPDWLKFIGKLAIARRKNERTIGLMLALSGANGNVIGSYNEDFAGDDTVQLIANDDLFSLIQEIYRIPNADEIKRRIVDAQGLDVEDMDLVYYKKKIRWLLYLGNSKYTICDAKGDLIERKSIIDVIPLLKNETPFDEAGYIDIFEDYERQRRINILKVRVINELVNARIVDKKVIDSISKETLTGKVEIDTIVKDDPFLTCCKINNREMVQLKEGIIFTDFYRYVLTSGFRVELLISEFYQTHINDDLITEICKIQYGLQLDELEKKNYLNVFRLSPSALLYALSPDRMLSHYAFTKDNETMRFIYHSHFRNELIGYLKDDFQNQGLHEIFLALGVENATIETKMIVGGKDDFFTLESNQNFKLAKIEGFEQVALLVTKKDVDKVPKNE